MTFSNPPDRQVRVIFSEPVKLYSSDVISDGAAVVVVVPFVDNGYEVILIVGPDVVTGKTVAVATESDTLRDTAELIEVFRGEDDVTTVTEATVAVAAGVVADVVVVDCGNEES